MLIRIIIAAVLIVVFSLLPAEGYLRFVLFMIPYLVIGYDILKKAFKGILNKQVFDENFLMAVATIGAIAIAIYDRSGNFNEAVAVMLFYQIGELFQSYAVGKSRRNISELMDIRPDYANIEQDGKLERVDPDEVEIGTVIVVQPGEKVPIDGIVIEGTSTLNTSALTGESLPRETKVGDEIISGCINMTGVLKIRTIKEFGESTVSKILELVENSTSRKSRSEDFISKFAKYYTPVVCYGALALAILPPLVRMLAMGAAPQWDMWIYRALTFLVISCPCALVISIPLSFFAGIGGASHEGVLVKGSNYLEAMSQTKYVVFDKTGTLTKGVFEVNGVHHSEMEEEKLLEYAALAESASSHPISRSIQRAYGKEIDRTRVSEIEEISGNGVTAKVDGKPVAAGNDKLMKRLGITPIACHSAGTIIHIEIDGKYMGHILISDVEKPTSKEAIRALKSAGIEKTVMLTGDAKRVADQVAEKLGLSQITYTEEILNVDETARRITVKRHIDGGVETVEGPLPIVLTVNGSAAPCRPRNAKLLQKYKRALGTQEKAAITKDGSELPYAELYEKFPYLNITEWSVADVEGDTKQCGLSGSPTKVKKIENIVFQAKESKTMTGSDQDVEGLIVELLANHTIG